MAKKGNTCSVTNLAKIKKKYGPNSQKYKNVVKRCGR
jgi:hypothetical protein